MKVKKRGGWRLSEAKPQTEARRGLASLDYVLVLGVILPLAGFILWIGPKMMKSVYQMICALIAWPFM